MVRARSEDGSKRGLSSPSARSIDVVEPDGLARDADGEELLARPELFRGELERLEHAEPQSAVQSARFRQTQKEG